MHATPSRILATVLALVASIFVVGCASRTVQLNVVRAAAIDVSARGGTIAVGPINGHEEAAQQIARDLEERIRHSLNPTIRLDARGGLVITGTVILDSYTEGTETVSETCSRTVDDGPDANGVEQSHTESYDCSYTQTVGTGMSLILLNVSECAGDRRPIFSWIYKHSDTVDSPSASDASRLMQTLRAATVADFSRVILPWQTIVTERFKDCDGDDLCKQALDSIKRSDFTRADALYSVIVAGFESPAKPVPKGEIERVSEAFYNRGVTRAYLGRFDEAAADLVRALAIQPAKTKWRAELEAIGAMARDQRALAAQGVPARPVIVR